MSKFFLLFFIIPFNLQAQNENVPQSNFSLSIGVKNHLPIHFFKRTYSYGFGGELNAAYKISNFFSVNLTPGYLKYFYNQKVTGVAGSTGFILLLSGIKFYPDKKIYINAEGGVGIKRSEFGSESALAYSGGAGFFITKNFDVELKYLKSKGTTFAPEVIGINANYTFYRNRRFKKEK